MLMISSCHTTVELHDKRHRQIASIVQSIQRLDRVHITVRPVHSKKKKEEKRKCWEENDADPEPKDSIQEPGVEWDDQSSTMNEEEAEDKLQHCTAETRKAAKAERKAAKNQTRFNVITQDDMENVQRSLHPEIGEFAEPEKQAQNGQGLTDNKTIEDNIAFSTRTYNWGCLRRSVHQKKIIRANNSRKPITINLDEQNEIFNPILISLGVRVDVLKATKERKSLETKLRNAIMEDILAFQNEEEEKMQRMAGYWRYVNRRTYNEMVKNNELWDWATGQKLPEIEEESELESVEEEDGENHMDGATYVGTPNVWSPEGSDNETDVEGGEGSPFALKTSFGPGGDDPKTPTKQTSSDDLFEYARERMEKLSIPKLKASLQSPTPSLDSSPQSLIPNENDKSLNPNTPYQGQKDTRNLAQAIHILPPSPIPHAPTSPTPSSYRIPSPTTILPSKNITDLGNRYRNLRNELPAPCEEIKPTLKTQSAPLKTTVLIIPKPVAKMEMVVEEGWEVKGGKGKREVFPRLGKGKVKGKGRGKGKGGVVGLGMGMDFVGAVRRGVV